MATLSVVALMSVIVNSVSFLFILEMVGGTKYRNGPRFAERTLINTFAMHTAQLVGSGYCMPRLRLQTAMQGDQTVARLIPTCGPSGCGSCGRTPE